MGVSNNERARSGGETGSEVRSVGKVEKEPTQTRDAYHQRGRFALATAQGKALEATELGYLCRMVRAGMIVDSFPFSFRLASLAKNSERRKSNGS
jgi:hypothetical protein